MKSPIKQDNQGREWGIDALRGVAALVVVAEHYLRYFFPSALTEYAVLTPGASWWEYLTLPPFNLFNNGAAAVSLFFVLSGYVLTKGAIATGIPSITRSFFSRYIRLAIPALASLLLVFLYARTGLLDSEALVRYTSSMEHPILVSAVTLPAVLYQGMVGSMFQMAHSLNPPLWTVTYEMLGSMIVLGVCWMFPKGQKTQVVVVLALALFLRDTFLFGFALGYGVAILQTTSHHWGNLSLKLRGQLFMPVLIAGLVLLAYGVRGLQTSPYFALIEPSTISVINKYSINAVGATFILLAIQLYPRKLQISPSIRDTLQWLGTISFGLYLVHYPLMSVVAAKILFAISALFTMAGVVQWNYWFSVSLAIPVSLAVTFLAAQVFSALVDRRAITLSRSLRKRVIRTKQFSQGAPT